MLKTFLTVILMLYSAIAFAHPGHITLGINPGNISGVNGFFPGQLPFRLRYTMGLYSSLYDGQYNFSGNWQPFKNDGAKVVMSMFYSNIELFLNPKAELKLSVPWVFNTDDRAQLGPLDDSGAITATNTGNGLGDLRITGSILSVAEDIYSPAIIFTGGFVLPTGTVILDKSGKTSTGGGTYNICLGGSLSKTFNPVTLSVSLEYESFLKGEKIPTFGDLASYNMKFNNLLSYSFGILFPLYSIEEEKILPALSGWDIPQTKKEKRPVITSGVIWQGWDIIYSQRFSGLSIVEYYKEHKTQFGTVFNVYPNNTVSINFNVMVDVPGYQSQTHSNMRYNLAFSRLFSKIKPLQKPNR